MVKSEFSKSHNVSHQKSTESQSGRASTLKNTKLIFKQTKNNDCKYQLTCKGKTPDTKDTAVLQDEDLSQLPIETLRLNSL